MRRLPKSLSTEAFKLAWHDSNDAKHPKSRAAGVDGVRPANFATDLATNINKIRAELHADTFQFEKLRFAPVLKANGIDFRIIAIPTVRDRLMQRTLLQDLVNDPNFSATSEVSYGFTKGKTLQDAQRRALALRSKHPWVLQSDITGFFDNIPRLQLKTLVRRQVRRRIVIELLHKAIDCEIEPVGGDGAQILVRNGIVHGKGLRQGMPISPMLSNLLLKAFDQALVARGMNAVRYADDIVVFGDSRLELRDALQFINGKLNQLQLKIPELGTDKTKISDPSVPVEFLGIEIRKSQTGYFFAAPARKLQSIEKSINESSAFANCIKERRTLSRLNRWLESFVVGHTAALSVLDDANSFRQRLEALKAKALDRLLVSVIGQAAFDKLDLDDRAVLGLRPFD